MRIQGLLSLAFSTMSSSTAAAAFKNSEATIRKVLMESKTIALVGASAKPERPAYHVMEYLLKKGYNVIPINPGLEGQELLGQQVYKDLSAVPDPIDMVDIFRNSNACVPIVDEAIAVGAKSIWMQVGVINEQAAANAEGAGMNVVMNTCPKIEIPKLGIDGPTSEL